MYDPVEYKRACDSLEHGKAKMDAIRKAIEEADANEDRPYQFYFREKLCEESSFYGDDLDLLVIFPELLALADRYPDTPTTQFESGYNDALDRILWSYKWVLISCKGYYQIPMEDCMKFFEDFKRRSLAYGYNLRPYYYFLYEFYKGIDKEKAEEAFYAFERLPRDGNCDCQACERNTAIQFYLERGKLLQAARLSKDIENRTLRCGDYNTAWLGLKENYLSHFMDEGNLEEALKYCKLLERYKSEMTQHQNWSMFICCYAHSDLGKALKLYKEYWKQMQENRRPVSIFWNSLYLSVFFKKLSEARKGKTVKLSLDSSFPLFREDGQYRINDLYEYYYQKAETVAKKLDARNGVDVYQSWLKEGIVFHDPV